MWGPGRPGWHIECSALALRELGTTIDLHGGGADLIFPHHECERAQSEAATGEPFVRHWMHQAMVRMDGEKMSKSLGNLVFVDDLLQDSGTRERSGSASSSTTTATAWEWDDDAHAAGRGPARPRGGGRGGRVGNGKALDEVRGALDDDLDTPRALAAIDAAARAGSTASSSCWHRSLGVELGRRAIDRACRQRPSNVGERLRADGRRLRRDG